MSIENEEDLEGMKEVGLIVGATLKAMKQAVHPGITTNELNAIGAEMLDQCQAQSAPMLVYDYPAETCISVNDEVVHGIPSDRRVEKGDLVTLDVTAEKENYMADAAVTIAVPPALDLQLNLVVCAEVSFYKALRVASAGKRVNQIGRVVEYVSRRHGFSVIRGLSGHGIGRTIHEEPSVPNTYEFMLRDRLSDGLVLTVEPMITTGSGKVVEADDGWTIKTADRSLSAHYEHTIIITRGRPIILTAA